jgi:hypothetical protein
LNASRFDLLREKSLQWLPELGVGWFPVEDSPYDASYWERYRRLDETPAGACLTSARLRWVSRFWDGGLVDIGIGGGRFVRERQAVPSLQFQTWGYDINPYAEQWLRERHAWANPYRQPLPAASFWDSLEHIHDPAPLLDNISHWVFTSLPIFDGPEHVLRSKHFRRDEHCWYFTRQGIEAFMHQHGFDLVERCDMEQSAGREDIETFAFRRR